MTGAGEIPSGVILGDWGTTRLRLFRRGSDGALERLAGPGIGQLAGSPAQTLLATLAPWREAAQAAGVLLCGMAGSRSGLVEAPYVATPANLEAWAQGAARLRIDGAQVTVAAGLRSTNFAGRPDVMRGEEAQIFGALARDPALASGRRLLVLPGTHSKWAELVDGRVARFHTFPTGELFALMRDHSTLTRAGADESDREAGFAAGVASADGSLLGRLFEARAAQLVDGRSHGWSLGFLSGLLIACEFAEALEWLGAPAAPIVLVGDPGLLGLYAQAARARRLALTEHDGDACAIAGLARLAELEC